MALFSPWRADFPALAVLEAQGQTYLDSAATAQKPQALIDALSGYYTCGAANVHHALHNRRIRCILVINLAWNVGCINVVLRMFMMITSVVQSAISILRP